MQTQPIKTLKFGILLLFTLIFSTGVFAVSNITLITPPDSLILNESILSQTFSCNATSDVGLSQLGLLIWNSTDGQLVNTLGPCYQETANVATLCGGLNTGTYAVDGRLGTNSWSSTVPYTNLYDGNDGTSSHARDYWGEIWPIWAYLYINYTKPVLSNYNSIWQLDGVNYTLPSSCWNAYTDKLSFRLNSITLSGQMSYARSAGCWNGTDWAESNIVPYTTGSYRFYEEKMYWNLTLPGNLSFAQSWNFTLPDKNDFKWACISQDINGAYTYSSNSSIIHNPDIVLTSPSNSLTLGTTNISFSCSASDLAGLSNTTIYIWNSTNDLILQNTSSLSGTINSSSFSFNMPYNDTFKWNCEVYNILNHKTVSPSNYTLTINTNVPVIIWNSPTLDLITKNNLTYFNSSIFNYQSMTFNLYNPSLLYSINQSNNQTWTLSNLIQPGIPSEATYTGGRDFFKFYNSSTVNAIYGGATSASFTGVTWQNNSWVANSTITTGLSGTNNFYPTVFSDFFNDGQNYLIAGISSASTAPLGWRWNGTAWRSNSTIVTGFPAGAHHNIKVFKWSGQWLALDAVGGTVTGYYWNGTSWKSNTTWNSGLPVFGTDTNNYKATMDVWSQDNITLNLIATSNTAYYGYQWNGSGWTSNSSLVWGIINTDTRRRIAVTQDLFGTTYASAGTRFYIKDKDSSIFYISMDLPDANYSYSITAVGPAGTTISGNRSILIDTTAPNISLISPTNNTFTNIALRNFSCNFSDNLLSNNVSLYIWNSTGTLKFNNTLSLGKTGIASWQYIFNNPGIYFWGCSAIDFMGNIKYSNNYTYNYDLSPTSIVEINSNGSINIVGDGTCGYYNNLNVSSFSMNYPVPSQGSTTVTFGSHTPCSTQTIGASGNAILNSSMNCSTFSSANLINMGSNSNLDCRGNTIYMQEAATGWVAIAMGTGSTIKNCIIDGYPVGIQIANNARIYNTTLISRLGLSLQYSLYLYGATNSLNFSTYDFTILNNRTGGSSDYDVHWTQNVGTTGVWTAYNTNWDEAGNYWSPAGGYTIRNEYLFNTSLNPTYANKGYSIYNPYSNITYSGTLDINGNGPMINLTGWVEVPSSGGFPKTGLQSKTTVTSTYTIDNLKRNIYPILSSNSSATPSAYTQGDNFYDSYTPCMIYNNATPTITFNTTENAYCRVGTTPAGYYGMNNSMNCSTTGGINHICSPNLGVFTGNNIPFYVACLDYSLNDMNYTNSNRAFFNDTISPPIVNLITPSNNYLSSYLSNNLICNASDYSLKNISLYIWDSGGSLIYLSTSSASGSYVTKSTNVNFPATGNYIWNCLAEGYNGNSFSQNRTISIYQMQPTMIQYVPQNNSYTNTLNTIFTCNANATSLANATIYLWNSTNDLIAQNTTSLSGSINSSSWLIPLPGIDTYTWTCTSTDYLGNVSYYPSNYTLKVDPSPPTASIITPPSPTDNYLGYNSTQFNISCNVSDEISVRGINLYIWNSNGTLYQNLNSTNPSCYQEHTNSTSDCGGIFSPKSTYGYTNGYIFMNYTKPDRSVGATWRVKLGRNIAPETRNQVIPQSCWDAYPDILVVRANPVSQGGAAVCANGAATCNLIHCYNSTGGWTQLYSTGGGTAIAATAASVSNVWDGNWATGITWDNTNLRWGTQTGTSSYTMFYEEAMLWNITQVNGTSGNASWYPTLPAGSYKWNCIGSDIADTTVWANPTNMSIYLDNGQGPSITSVVPTNNSNNGWTVSLMANVIDATLQNVWYEIRNGTISAPIISSGTMNNIGGYIYNATFITNDTWPYDSLLYNYTNLTLVVYANDSTGLISNASTYWSLHNEFPGLQIIYPTEGVTVHDPFNLNIALSNYRLNYSNYTITNSTGQIIKSNQTNLAVSTFTWSDLINLSLSPSGNYTLNVYVRDFAQAATTNNITFFLDNTRPSFNYRYPLDNTHLTERVSTNFICNTTSLSNLTQISLNIWDSSNLLIYTSFNQTNQDSFYFDRTLNLPFDTYKWSCSASNQYYSNISSSNYTLLIQDDISPSINFVPPTYQDGVLSGLGNITINVSSSDNVLVQSITIFLYDSAKELYGLWSSVIGAVSGYLYYSFTGIDDGTYYYNATATDAEGNTNSTETRNITLGVIGQPPISSFSTTYGSTNFTQIRDFTNVANLVLANEKTKIGYINNVNISGANLDTNISLLNNIISVDSISLSPTMNTSANITLDLNNISCDNFRLYYSPGFYTSISNIIAFGTNVATEENLGGNCLDSSICQNLACSNGVLTFKAMHFDSFGVSPNSPSINQINGSGSINLTSNNNQICGYYKDSSQIFNCVDLQNMQNDLTKNYTLMNNIDCSGTINWNSGAGFIPVGNNLIGTGFSGTFNGQGFNISNLYINKSASSGVGLFGGIVTNATLGGNNTFVKDVGFINASMNGGTTQIGILAGLIRTTNSKILISQIFAINSIVNTTTSTASTGGLIGQVYSSGSLFPSTITINKCYATTNVIAPSSTASQGVGGLIGTYQCSTNANSQIVVSNSYATGNLTGGSMVGGFHGRVISSSPSIVNITNSYALGNVNASVAGSGYAEGFGFMAGITNATNIFAVGNVEGDTGGTNAIGPITQALGVTNGWYYSGATCLNRGGGGCNTNSAGSYTTLSSFYSSANAPLNTWDFTNVWYESGTDLPTLQMGGYSNISSLAGYTLCGPSAVSQPNISFTTKNNATCRFSNLAYNYTQMNNTMNCSSYGNQHSCSLYTPVLEATGNYTLYLACADGSITSDYTTSPAFNFTYSYIYADVIGPTITFFSQFPADLNLSNFLGPEGVNVTYNITDVSGVDSSSLVAYQKTNNSIDDIDYYINGTAYSGYINRDGFYGNSSSLFTWKWWDNQVLPAIYNYPERSIETTLHSSSTLTNNIDYLSIQLLNVSNTKQYGFFEIMANRTSGTGNLRFYYCNSSYAFGNNPATNTNCLNFYSTSNTTYAHTHSQYSSHLVAPFPINTTSGKIGSVQVTQTSYFMIRGANSNTFTYYHIPNLTGRTNAYRTSANGGNSWTDQSNTFTVDSHLHQFGTNTSLWYYVCANDTLNNSACSTPREDRFELAGLPPTSPDVYSPTNATYSNSIPINYTESVSPNAYAISFYNISLYNTDYSFNMTIESNNSNNLSYLWNSTDISAADYIIQVKACDILAQCSSGYSEQFTITHGVGPTAPSIISVNAPATTTLNTGTTKTIYAQFNASDENGASDLNDTTAQITVFKSGETSRTSSGCSLLSSGITWKAFNCTITMMYYDGAGTWNVNASISDNLFSAYNSTETFNVNNLDAITLTQNNINFGSSAPGTYNISGTPQIINNTGNQNYINITLKAYSLLLGSGSAIMEAPQFCANSISSPIGCNFLVNNTAVSIGSGLTLSKGSNSYNISYHYANIPIGKAAGIYTATQNWIYEAS